MAIGESTLILKCSAAECEVNLDGDFLTSLVRSSVVKITIDSGEHLLEFKNGHATSTKIINANPNSNVVIYDEELQKEIDLLNKPIKLFASKEDEEEFTRKLRQLYEGR